MLRNTDRGPELASAAARRPPPGPAGPDDLAVTTAAGVRRVRRALIDKMLETNRAAEPARVRAGPHFPPMSGGEAAIKATVDYTNGLTFEESGLPADQRDLWDEIAAQVDAIIAEGLIVDIPPD